MLTYFYLQSWKQALSAIECTDQINHHMPFSRFKAFIYSNNLKWLNWLHIVISWTISIRMRRTANFLMSFLPSCFLTYCRTIPRPVTLPTAWNLNVIPGINKHGKNHTLYVLGQGISFLILTVNAFDFMIYVLWIMIN
jgi:hypothetical protein